MFLLYFLFCSRFSISAWVSDPCSAPYSFSASLLSGFCVTVAMNPADVISTRLYNQPVVNGKGTSYNGIVDCAVKTIKTEGVRGLYKGFTAHYMRLGPHTILTFVFWEQFKAMAARRGL